MSMMIKGIPILVLVGMALLIIGGLFHIIGLATPYWHSITTSNSAQQNVPWGHHGLWMACGNVNDDTVDCSDHAEAKGFLLATRAFEILALLFGITCMCVTGVWFFLDIQSHRLILMISSLSSGFLSGLCGIIGIIIYAAEINSQDREVTIIGQLTETSLSWSFALCTLSACIGIIAVILIAVGIRMKTD